MKRQGRCILSMLLSIFCISGYGQVKNYQIIVRDSVSKEDVSDAFIQNVHTGYYSFTDADGQAMVPASMEDSILISTLGYKDKFYTLGIDVSPIIYVVQKPFVEVTIYADKKPQSLQDSRLILTPETIKKQVLLAGEADPIRALQFVPGVSNTREGMSGLVVRGGLPDQNLLLVDGIRIYNYTHLFGFLSFFNDDAIKDMTFYKSGIPAEYGGRASSVVNINLKDGHPDETQGRFSIGMLTSKLYLSKPVIKNKWNISTALRTSYFDLLEPFQSVDESEFGTNSSRALNVRDFTFKSTYRISERSKFTLNYLYTRDADKRKEISIDKERNVNRSWGNHLISGQYNRSIGSKSYFNLSMGYYRYNYNYFDEEVRTENSARTDVTSGVKEYSIHGRLRHQLSKGNVAVGVQYFYTAVDPLGLQFIVPSENFKGSIATQRLNEFSIYQEWKYNPGNTSFRIGNRINTFFHDRGSSLHLLPRIGIYREWKSHQLSFEYDRNLQNAFTSSPISLNVPLDIWLLRNNPAISEQWTIGWNRNLSEKWHAKVNLYRKTIDNHIELAKIYQRLDKDLLDLNNFVLDGGRISARGVEASLKYESPLFSQLINFTYQTSQSNFRQLNDGNDFPTSYVRSILLTTNSQLKINEKWVVGTSITYSTGQPITLPVNSYFRFGGFQQYIFKDRNNASYPDYFRLDLLLNWKKSEKSTWTISVYNATAYQNPFHIILDADTKNGEFFSSFYKRELLFTILPTISYARVF